MKDILQNKNEGKMPNSGVRKSFLECGKIIYTVYLEEDNSWNVMNYS